MKRHMIFASCRQDFTSTVFHAPLQFRDEISGEALSFQQVLDDCANCDVDIFVHGYRNRFAAASIAYLKMALQLERGGISGRRIGFFWCGSWVNLGFFAAVARTKKASAELAELINRLNVAGCRVTLETHSLGARVALQAVARGAYVDRLILTAPAVNVDIFREGGEFRNAIRNVGQVTVMWSGRDRVLKTAYWIASGFRKALGLVGCPHPRPQNVRSIDLTAEVREHGAYKDCDAVFLPKWWRG